MKSAFRDQESAILRDLQPKLAERGFTKKRGQDFIRKTPDGFHVVHLMFARYDTLVVLVDVAIRFDAVEALLDRGGATARLTDRQKAERVTLGVELGNWLDGRNREIDVGGPEGVARAVGAVLELCDGAAQRYFTEYGTPGAALGLLRGSDKRSTMHSVMPLARAERRVALALVVEGADAARREVDAAARDLTASDLQAFRAFVTLVLAPS